MVKKMKLFVLMRGRYDVAKGAKIHFHLEQEKNLYIASCDQKDFGIVKYLKDGNKKELQMLGTDFDGVILRTDFNQYLAEVAVKREGKAA